MNNKLTCLKKGSWKIALAGLKKKSDSKQENRKSALFDSK